MFGMASSSPTSSVSVPTTTTSVVREWVRGQAIATTTTSLGRKMDLVVSRLWYSKVQTGLTPTLMLKREE
jgi:hypothetical protein